MDVFSYIVKHIRPSTYYKTVFPEVAWNTGQETTVFCPFHEDRRIGGRPSMTINPTSGAFFCHSCEAKGRSIISFHAKLKRQKHSVVLHALFDQFIQPLVPIKNRTYQQRLFRTPQALNYLMKKRKLTRDTIQKARLGFDGSRITIPIYNEFGYLINIRRFDPLAEQHDRPKMVNYRDNSQRRYGSTTIYPIQVLLAARPGEEIVICEGEFDCLLLNQIGLRAITSTSGAQSWPSRYNRMFVGLRVVLLYDNDTAGRKGERKVVHELFSIANSIHTAKILSRFGKDPTDWVRVDPRMLQLQPWKHFIERRAKEVKQQSEILQNRLESKDEIANLTLDEASKAEWYGRTSQVPALVSGKDTSPYILPQRVRIICNKTDACSGCPMNTSKSGIEEISIGPDDPIILEMIDISSSSLRRIILKRFGAKEKCSAKIEIVEMFNVEQVALTPTLDSATGRYVMRTGFFVGHGIVANRGYLFEGATHPFPCDQHAIHLFWKKSPLQDEIETFSMTPNLFEELKQFQPRRLSLMAHLMSIAEWQSRHITKIRERPDMHIAVDLVFHSVDSFIFNHELVSRGMLDVLILGDTRCGKGYVTERLTRYYGLGDIASGENCSFAGLVGGLQQIGKRWMVTWGILPLNHRRLVVIDEMSSMSEEELGHMSRVRSEGVAEISKIIKEVTPANTRLIWLANCRSGRPIMTYNTGVEAVKELVGNNEDISRFDFVTTVAADEVPSEIINILSHREDVKDAHRFSRFLCRSLVLWAWSRRSEDIRFTRQATRRIIRESIKFGRQYSSAIPLVQAENIRVKLAKVAAAVAARVFSTDPTGEMLIVNSEHVHFACSFLRMLYSKPSLAYDLFSRSDRTSFIRMDENKLIILFKNMGRDQHDCILGLLDLHRITPDNLADYVGDVVLAKSLISDLVRMRCISRDPTGNWYIKNPRFITWLRNERSSHEKSKETSRSR